jgi:hypothetical protein
MIPRARIAKPAGFEDPIRSKTAVLEETSAGHRSLPVSETGRVRGVRDAGRRRRKWIFCRNFSDGAAQESNLPTVGLQRPAGFEDQAGLAQRSGVSGVCAPKRAPEVRCFALTSLGLVSASLGAGDGRGCGRDVPAILRVSTSSVCARCSGVVTRVGAPVAGRRLVCEWPIDIGRVEKRAGVVSGVLTREDETMPSKGGCS